MVKESLMERLKKVLIDQVGWTRQCPRCEHVYIPDDLATKSAWEMYQELFKGDKSCGSKTQKRKKKV